MIMEYTNIIKQMGKIIGLNKDKEIKIQEEFNVLIYQAFTEHFIDAKETITSKEIEKMAIFFDEYGNIKKDMVSEFITFSSEFLPHDTLAQIFEKSKFIAFTQMTAIILENALPEEQNKIEALIKTQPELKKLYS